MNQLVAMFAVLTSVSVPCDAIPRFGNSTRAAWLSMERGYQPGTPVVTALRLSLKPGWHTYWINPGEAGMPLSATFDLPDGWSADPVQYPFPKRFKSGDLHDFGYAGTIWFPIVLHPPPDATGDVELTATFSWLICNDASCVPGNSVIPMKLSHGDTTKTATAPDIEKALARIPQHPPSGWRLEVKETASAYTLTITMPDGIHADDLVVFPATRESIHPAETFQWNQVGNVATANARKSPYAKSPIPLLELVVNHPHLNQPVALQWQQDPQTNP